MPVIEATATRESACVSTAPVFQEWEAAASGGWWPARQFRLSADWRGWWLWLSLCVCCASAPGLSYPLRFLLLWCLLACNALLPASGDSVAPFWCLVLTLPPLVAKSVDAGYAWSMVPFLFVVVPTVDLMSGADLSNFPKETQKERERELKWRLPPIVGSVLVVLNCVSLANTPFTSWLNLVGAAVSCGVYTGSVGINTAHELCHRASSAERTFGRLSLIVCGYGHFLVEHTLGHHKHVGLDADPATARYGESFWQFLPRCLRGEFRSALTIATANGTLLADVVLPYLATVVFCIGLSVSFGFQAVPFFLIQSFVAVVLFESVNYVEHYGLERASPDTVVDAHHSWDSANRFSNHLLFQLQRHADHHAHAGKRYQCLQLSHAAPTLPAGYATMILFAFVPRLWRSVIHHRLHAHRKRLLLLDPATRFRHGPLPDKKLL